MAFAQEQKPLADTTVLRIFRRYEALNNQFLGSAGQIGQQRRRELEDYAEGPYTEALTAATRLVCAEANRHIVEAFFQVLNATTNSAYEEPSWVLGRMFACQPKLVSAAFRALRPAQRRQTYELLYFGFGNILPELKAADTTALRVQLQALAPSKSSKRQP